mgnify:FL=1
MNNISSLVYDPFFNQAAEKNNIDPDDLRAIADIETGYRVDVITGKTKGTSGEVGIGQFMEGTAADYGLIDRETGEDYRSNPVKSIQAMAKLHSDNMQWARKTLGEDAEEDAVKRLAVEAYNGGRGNAGKSKQTAQHANKFFISYTKLKQQQPVQPAQEKAPVKKQSSFNLMSSAVASERQEIDKKQYKEIKVNPNDDDKTNKSLYKNLLPPKIITEKDVDLTDDKYFYIIKDYMETRFKNSVDIGGRYLNILGKKLDDKSSRKEYINEFLYQMRYVDWNSTLGAVPELTYITNTSDKNVLIAAKAHRLYDEIPNFYDSIAGGVGESLFGALSDLSNWVGVGTGAIVKHKLAREGINKLFKSEIERRFKNQFKKEIAEDKLSISKNIKQYKKDLKKDVGTLQKDFVAGPLTKKVKRERNEQLNKMAEVAKKKASAEFKKDMRKDLKLKDDEKLTQDLKRKYVLGSGILPRGTSVKGKAMKVGALTEGLVGFQASIIDANIDKELERTESRHYLNKQKQQGLISENQYYESLEQVDKNTSLKNPVNMFGIAINTGISAIFGGLGARSLGYKDIGDESLGELYSKEIQGLKKARAADIQAGKISPVEIDYEGLSNSFNSDLNLLYTHIATKKLTKEGEKELLSSVRKIVQVNNPGKEVKDLTSFRELLANNSITIKQLKDEGLADKLDLTTDIINAEGTAKLMGVGLEILSKNQYRYKDVIDNYFAKRDPDSPVIGGDLTNLIQKVFRDVQIGESGEESFVRVLKQSKNLNEEQIADFLGAGVSEAGKILNRASQTAKDLKKYIDNNPELKPLLDFDAANKLTEERITGFKGTMERIKNLERNSKAFVVSAFGTTVRNVMGTSVGLTFKSAANVFDAAFYAGGTVINSVVKGKYTSGNFKNNIETDMSEIVHYGYSKFYETAGLYKLFTPKGQNRFIQQFDEILKDDDTTKKLLLTSLQETGEARISSLARKVNMFNTAQDAFFRRAFFVNSVETQLVKAGLVDPTGKDKSKTLESFLALDKMKVVPSNIIKQASDDALTLTFAKLPRRIDPTDPASREMAGGLERMGNNALAGGVDFLEKFPGTSLVIPFPRFMANAMQWQYKYSWFNGLAGVAKLLDTLPASRLKEFKKLDDDISFNEKLFDERNAAKARLNNPETLDPQQAVKDKKFLSQLNNRIKRRAGGMSVTKENKKALEDAIEKSFGLEVDLARKKISESAIGTAAFYGAYKYREENQDIEWYKIKTPSGGTVDIRAVFPLGPILAFADLVYRIGPKGSDRDKLNDKPWVAKQTLEYLEAFAGMKIQQASLGTTVSNIVASFEQIVSEGIVGEKLMKSLGNVFGDFINRFQQPVQPMYALVDSMDKEFQIQRDTRAVTSSSAIAQGLETFYNKVIGRSSAGLMEGVGSIVDLLPGESAEKFIDDMVRTKKELPPKIKDFDSTLAVTGGGLFNDLIGVKVAPGVSEVAKEFQRLDINPYPIYSPMGIPAYDRAVLAETVKDIEESGALYNYIKGYEYNSPKLPATEKRKILKGLFSNIVKSARARVLSKLQNTDVQAFGKVKFKQLSKEDRNNIRQRSKALYEKNGVPENERLDIEDDYTRIFILQDNLSMYPIDVPYNEPYDPNTIFKQGEVLMPPVD